MVDISHSKRELCGFERRHLHHAPRMRTATPAASKPAIHRATRWRGAKFFDNGSVAERLKALRCRRRSPQGTLVVQLHPGPPSLDPEPEEIGSGLQNRRSGRDSHLDLQMNPWWNAYTLVLETNALGRESASLSGFTKFTGSWRNSRRSGFKPRRRTRREDATSSGPTSLKSAAVVDGEPV